MNELVKYKIRCEADPLHDTNWTKEVEGEVLVLPDFPNLKLFIRQNIHAFNWWEITEAKTGMLLAESFGQEMAINKLIARIAEIGIEKVENTIREQVKIFGGELNA